MNRFADHTHWLHWLFVGTAKYGIVLFALALLTGWWLARRANSIDGAIATFWAGAAALVALGVAQVVGHIVDRPRPYDAIPSAHVLIGRTTDFSFPSDHGTAAGAVAVGLLLAGARFGVRWVGGITLALAIAMAVSRVYVGAHYPGDVLVGLVLGGAVAAAGLPLADRILMPIARALESTPARALITREAGSRVPRPLGETAGRVAEPGS